MHYLNQNLPNFLSPFPHHFHFLFSYMISFIIMDKSCVSQFLIAKGHQSSSLLIIHHISKAHENIPKANTMYPEVIPLGSQLGVEFEFLMAFLEVV